MIQTAVKIHCAALECKFCNDKGICTAKEISLSWHSVNTVHEGRQEYNRCKSYELSGEARAMLFQMQKLLNERSKE